MKRTLTAATLILFSVAIPTAAHAAASWTSASVGQGAAKAARLAAPGSVSVSCVQANRPNVKIEWSAAGRSSFATKFEVIRSSSSTLSSPTVITTVNVVTGMTNAQTFTDTTATTGTYFWAVRSVGGTANAWATNSAGTSKAVVSSPNGSRACA